MHLGSHRWLISQNVRRVHHAQSRLLGPCGPMASRTSLWTGTRALGSRGSPVHSGANSRRFATQTHRTTQPGRWTTLSGPTGGSRVRACRRGRPRAAREAIEALREHEAWAIIRRSTRAGDRDTVGLVGGRGSVVESLLDVPLEHGAPEDGHIADRLLGDPLPPGARARVRGPRRRHSAGRRGRRERARVHGRRGGRGDRRRRGDLRRPRRLRDRRRRVRQARRGRHRRRDRPGRGRQPGHRPPLPRHRRRLGRRQGARRLQAAARARARRLLDLPLLHRRPLPDRRQPRAARHGPRRRRADEPDQRHLPHRREATATTSSAVSSASCTTRRRSTSSSWSSTRS